MLDLANLGKVKLKVARNEKQKNVFGFSFSINIANYEAFFLVKKLSANLFFQKSVLELLFVNMMPIMNFH